jgi:hypothetical protein
MSTRFLARPLLLAVASLTAAFGISPSPAPAVEPGSILVRAVGDRDPATGEPVPLAGALMRAYADVSLTTTAGDCTTDAAGECTVTGLAPGTYYVGTVAAPAGGAFDVVTELTTAGGEAPYVEAVSVGEGSPTTRRFVLRHANPPYPSRCGVRVSLVFDVSGSIDASELATMKTASHAFVDALAGSPSAIAVNSFATTAPAAGNTNYSPISVEATTGVATVKASIAALTGTAGNEQFTNWDAALRAAAADASDVVLLFTDGNPTVYGVPAVFPPVVTGLDQIEGGVLSANALKAAGTRVVAIGIGDAADISEPNLRAVSGPVEGSDYAVTSFAGLEQVFADLADALCPKPAPPPIIVEPEIVLAPVPVEPRFTG